MQQIAVRELSEEGFALFGNYAVCRLAAPVEFAP